MLAAARDILGEPWAAAWPEIEADIRDEGRWDRECGIPWHFRDEFGGGGILDIYRIN